MAGKVSAFVTSDVARRRLTAIFMSKRSADDPMDIALIKYRRLVHGGNSLNGGVIVLLVQQDHSIICDDEIIRPNFTLLQRTRFEIGKFDFENRTPRHFGNARCNHSRSERDFTLIYFVAPLRPA